MKTVKSLLCTILATIFLATQSILPISAAESSAPSLGAISFKNEKLESVYTKVDKALDRAIGRVEAKLTSRERWALKQSLATIRSRFIGIDQAMSERDREGFKSEVKIFKTQYTTVITFLKNVESREEVRTSKPTLASTESVGTGQVALPKAQAQYLSREAFANLGVRLDASIASSYLRWETLSISGEVTTADAATLLFLLAPDRQTRFIWSLPNQGTRFEYRVPLKEAGEYSVVVAAGKSFETKTPASIFVSDPVEESAGLPETSAPEIQALSFERMNFTDLTGVNVMSFDQDRPNTLYTVTISDSAGHSVIRRGMGAVSFFWDDLSSFTSGDSVRVRVTARDSVSRGSVDAYTASKMVFDQNMTLADSYAPKNEIGFDVRVRNGSEIEIVGTTPADERILATEMYIIQPDGSVQVRSFDSLIADPNDSAILKKNTPVAYSFDAPEDGVYLVEVNYDTGFAAVNVPIVIGNSSLPLAANVIDQMREEDYASIDEVDRASLEFLNALRARYGLGKLRLSDKLDRLAQIKADDMAANSYVGHVDSEGVYIDGTAKRHDISLTKSLSENVAGGNVGYGILNSALSLSGGHRANMLGSDWTTVGIGIARDGDRAYYVQVFGME